MKKINEDKYYAEFPVDQTLPEPPFNVSPHWTIPIIIIGGLLTVVVCGVAFGLYVYYTTPEMWIR